MAWLLEMELVRRVVPITVGRPDRSKLALYCIDDPYVRFWHRFVAPLVRSGRAIGLQPARQFRERIAPRLDEYMGPVFEEICRDFVRRSNRLGFRPDAVGEWWNRSSDSQIDVVALTDRDEDLFGE